ncbi:MAG: arsenate reductase ArsC [Fidelibacterota bacterium]|nr:MAG: arsenate reductase ArsC [Candidatus Neomarinimicrobiota bacterium]
MPKVLILCTGNSCRSQMAEGLLRSIDPSITVCSAGTNPAPRVHPKAIQVMAELGLDIGAQTPKSVDQFLSTDFDFVITVCNHARETCPAFTGSVKQRLHAGFEDPFRATGTEEEILAAFRRVRDEIKYYFEQFNTEYLQTRGE